MKSLRLILKFFLLFLIIIFIFILLSSIYVLIKYTMNDYKPKEAEKTIDLYNPGNLPRIKKNKKINILSWNVANTNKGDDYIVNLFPRPNKNREPEIRVFIYKFIEKEKFDIVTFQEAGLPFSKEISHKFNNYSFHFTYNLKDFHMPFEGKMNMGLLSINSYLTSSTMRFKLPGKRPWPFNLFLFKRCIIESRFPIENDSRELIVINLHLEFFDRNERVRTAELKFLKEKILDEYNKGNSVILCGDWNLIMPGLSNDRFKPWTTPEKYTNWLNSFHKGWTPKGWQWAYPKDVPTVRTQEIPYEKGKNFTTVIDGFLLSPDIEIISVKGYDFAFKYSDHNPISIEIKIK